MLLSSWFRGLKGRLLIISFLPIIGFVVLFLIAFKGLSDTNLIVQKNSKELLPNALVLGEMRQARNKFAYQAWASLTDWNSPQKKEKRISQAEEALHEFQGAYEEYTKIPFQPGEKEIHNQFKDDIPPFLKAMRDILAGLKDSTPEGAAKVHILLDGDFAKLGSRVRDFNRDVNKLYNEISVKQAQTGEENEIRVRNLLIGLTVLCSFLVFAVLVLMAAKISKGISSIAENILGAGQQVSQSVGQLNQAGQSLASSSAQAASSLEETVATLEELTSIVKINAENAKQASRLSVVSRETAEKGASEVRFLIQSMNEISTSSRKIEEIISVIDDLAFQTNLLALNAAVESARAGEHGKGFAVVADAVRGLAQKSADAAQDISHLIRTSVGQIEEGAKAADRSGAVLSSIVESIKVVSNLNEEIAESSAGQFSGIEQISKAMNQLDQAVQNNAASAEEIAATGEQIDNLALGSQKHSAELDSMIKGPKAA